MSALGDELPHRRVDDASIAGLNTRMRGLEERVEVLEYEQKVNNRELRSNTALTRQVHEALYGRGDDDLGVNGKVEEMHSVFSDATAGLRVITKAAEVGGKLLKPLAYLVGLGIAIGMFVKTGVWKWP